MATQILLVTTLLLLKAVHMLFTETSVHCFCSNVSSIQKYSHQSLWIQMPVTTFLARWYKSCRSAEEYSVYPLQPYWAKRPIKAWGKAKSHTQTHCRQAFRATQLCCCHCHCPCHWHWKPENFWSIPHLPRSNPNQAWWPGFRVWMDWVIGLPLSPFLVSYRPWGLIW